jgi:hypothetical protein
MKGKRSGLDFSKHILEAHESTIGDEKIWQHYLRIPGQSSLGIRFTNVAGVLLVTGDFGNYVFSRGFLPSAESEKVSEQYWLEKIRMHSIQKPCNYDAEETIDSLNEAIFNAEENYGEGDCEAAIKYFEDCKSWTDDEWEYIQKSRVNMPFFMSSEDLVVGYKLHNQLSVVFDAYDRIIDIYKEQNTKQQ